MLLYIHGISHSLSWWPNGSQCGINSKELLLYSLAKWKSKHILSPNSMITQRLSRQV